MKTLLYLILFAIGFLFLFSFCSIVSERIYEYGERQMQIYPKIENPHNLPVLVKGETDVKRSV